MLYVFGAIMAATIAYLLLSPHKYEAELKLFVKRERVDALVMAEKGAVAPIQADIAESEIRSEIELLKSRSLMEQVVEKCGLASMAQNSTERQRRRELALAVNNLKKHLKIEAIPRTDLISVRYVDRDPQRAADVLKTLSALYLDKHTEVHRNRGTTEFFARQAIRSRQELSEAQKRLSQFERYYKASLLEERKQANLKRLGELEAQLQEAESQIQESEDRGKVLTSQMDSLPETVQAQARSGRNEALMHTLKSRLLELENKRTELLTKYEPGYRLVQEVDQQIRDTHETIAREESAQLVDETQALNPLRQNVESELLRAKSSTVGFWARKKSLSRDLERLQARQTLLDTITAEHGDLLRQLKLAEENYLLHQKKCEESRIADALDRQKIINVSILDPSTPPALPVNQYPAFVLMLGLLAAIFGSFGSALMGEYFDPSVATARQLAASSGLPVLAVMSRERILCS